LKFPTLNILFICSSLEPGKDGVGDYAHKLASALICHGSNNKLAFAWHHFLFVQPVRESEDAHD